MCYSLDFLSEVQSLDILELSSDKEINFKYIYIN